MLAYLAASEHNHYTKCVWIYLQQMSKLEDEHPTVYRHFIQGLHVVRRRNCLWAGLPTELVIEQAFMRTLKTTGGLTRGRGMTAATLDMGDGNACLCRSQQNNAGCHRNKL